VSVKERPPRQTKRVGTVKGGETKGENWNGGETKAKKKMSTRGGGGVFPAENKDSDRRDSWGRGTVRKKKALKNEETEKRPHGVVSHGRRTIGSQAQNNSRQEKTNQTAPPKLYFKPKVARKV